MKIREDPVVSSVRSYQHTIVGIDSSNNTRDITAQDVRAVPNQDFTQITFRLPDNLPAGTCHVKVVSQGVFSNTATFRIGT